MNLLLKIMNDRVEAEAAAGGIAMFDSLLKASEAYTKYVAAVLVSMLRSVDPPLAYKYEYELARTSGPGLWADAISELATSPSVNHAAQEHHAESVRQLSRNAQPGMWERDAVEASLLALGMIPNESVNLNRRMKLKDAFVTLAALRNRDSHGALLGHHKDEIGPHLRAALESISAADIFNVPVIGVSIDAAGLAVFRSIGGSQGPAPSEAIAGVYVGAGEPISTPLIHLDHGGRDLLFANGERGSAIEYLSYSSGNTIHLPNPVTALPTDRLWSETAARSSAYFGTSSITTAPSIRRNYVERPRLQEILMIELLDERRLIVTLRGMGGTGKTSLALWANERLTQDGPYDFIFWLSARDIDLQADGAQRVEPDVRTLADVAQQVSRALETEIEGDPIEWLKLSLADASLGRCLWIFDNFETFDDPAAVYKFIYDFIDRPHCALITSRERDYTGDRTIDVEGMEEEEFKALVERESDRLGIRLVPAQVKRLYDETLGHPYLAKLMLGEMKYGRETLKIERVIAGQEGVLPALFERTYKKLSDDGRLAFLALCEMNTLVLESALELALIQVMENRTGAAKAIREVLDYSLALALVADDDELFLETPTAARQYGQRHVKTDARSLAIKEMQQVLAQFAPTKRSDLIHGSTRYVQGLISSLRTALATNNDAAQLVGFIKTLGERYPVILARSAELLEEYGDLATAESLAVQYCTLSNDEAGWLRLARLREQRGDDYGALTAWVNRAEVPGVDFVHVSFAAKKFNSWTRHERVDLDDSEASMLNRRLANAMDDRIDEGTATDCATLGWLYVRERDFRRAYQVAERGLAMESNNEHCQRLLSRVKSG